MLPLWIPPEAILFLLLRAEAIFLVLLRLYIAVNLEWCLSPHNMIKPSTQTGHSSSTCRRTTCRIS